MRGPCFVFGCFVVGTLLGAPAVASAQNADAQALRQEIDRLRQDFDAVRKEYGDRLTTLETRLAAIQSSPQAPAPPVGSPTPNAPAEPAPLSTAQVPPGSEGAGGPSGSLPLYGAGAAASKAFNPDMAVIGDFLGAGGRNRVNPGPALAMHESEASFQAVVDPYARADFFISFGEEGVELEEGYLTFPALPGGLLVKVGKQRAAFGKVNALHNHVLPWTDRPLAINNLVGGEEGIDDAGFSVARLIPNPWMFLEATGQVFRGDSSDLFKSSTRGDLSYVGHLRGYHDITEDTNIDLGASYSRGHNAAGLINGVDVGRFTTDLYGIDATLRWRPLQRSIYHSFVGRSEVIWSRRQQPGGRQNSAGYFVSGDYQLARRWFAGARYDRSDRADDASVRDTGGSLLLTYWPSEFAQIRGQYRRIRFGDTDTANELLFQFQFSIGAHGAHPF
jgi:hypothetical protein